MTEPSERYGTSADRIHVRREADERFLAAISVGDVDSFGRLFDNWIDTVHDRLVRAGVPEARATTAEADAFEAAWRDTSSGEGASTFGATLIRHLTREAQDVERVVVDSAGAHDRVRRATDLAHVASDPRVGTMMFEAAHAMGAASSTIFDLSARHGFTSREIGEVVGREPGEVESALQRLPEAFEAVVRARLTWGDGLPGLWGGSDDEVAPVRSALGAAGVTDFDADAVRVLDKLTREDDRLRARAMIPLGASEIFAAIPLAGARTEHKRALAAALSERGVPMARSQFAPPASGPTAAAASAAAAAAARARRADPAPEPTVDLVDLSATSGGGRTPLLIGAAVLLAVLLIGGVALAMGGGGGGGPDDVAAEPEPEVVTTTPAPRRTTSTTAATTTTTGEPDDDPPDPTVAPTQPTTPATRPQPTRPRDPEPLPPPVVTTQTTLPSSPVPTTPPPEQPDVDLKVADSGGSPNEVFPSTYTRTSGPVVTWTVKGNPANVRIEIHRDGSLLEVIGEGQPTGPVTPCPDGWELVEGVEVCNVPPGEHRFVASYTVNGVRVEARNLPVTFR